MLPILPQKKVQRAVKAYNPLDDEFEVQKYDYYLQF